MKPFFESCFDPGPSSDSNEKNSNYPKRICLNQFQRSLLVFIALTSIIHGKEFSMNKILCHAENSQGLKKSGFPEIILVIHRSLAIRAVFKVQLVIIENNLIKCNRFKGTKSTFNRILNFKMLLYASQNYLLNKTEVFLPIKDVAIQCNNNSRYFVMEIS